MSNSCFTRPTNPCPLGVINSRCIVYTGQNLTNISVLTNDRLDIILQKINDAIGSGGGGSTLFISAGIGINITGAGTSGNPKVISSSITQYTDEQAQDAIGNILDDTSSITFTYNDFGPSITGNVVDAYFDAKYFKQNGNLFGAAARLGTNDAFALEFETNNSKAGEITTGGLWLLGGAISGSSKLQVTGSQYISGLLGLKNNTPTQTITVGDDVGGVNTLFIYAPDSSTGTISTSASSTLKLQGGSTIVITPDNDGAIVFASPTGYISQEFRDSTNTKYGEIGLASLGGGINEFYIKPFNSAEITLYDKIRLINIPQDDTTTKLLSIDATNRIRWHDGTLFAPVSGSANYIQNQFAGAQSANFFVSGHGRINDYLQINNGGRLVTDSTGKLASASSSDSTIGADFRTRVLRFWDSSVPNLAASSTSTIYSQQGNFLNLKADLNLILDAPVLGLNQATYLDAGSFHANFFIRGSQSSVGDFDYLGLWNANTAGDTKSVKVKLAFHSNRTTGGRTVFSRVGTEIVDFSNTLYKGDLVFETVDGAVSSGNSVEYFRIKYDGRLVTQNIPHAFTDTDRFLVWDSDSVIKYRTGAEILSDIGGGSGGGGVTSVAISSTDLSVSGSPITTSGTFTLNINNNAVTYAKMQDVSAASKLIGRGDSGAGDPQEITIGSGLQMVGTTLSATVGGGTPTLQQVLTSGSTLTGANTINAGGFNFTLNNNAIITLGASAAQIILDQSGQDITLTSTDKAFFKLATFGSATPGDVLSITNTTTGEVAWVANGVGAGGSVTSFSAGNLSPLFTSNVATATSTPALTFTLSNAGTHTWYGNTTAGSTTPSFNSNAALTKTDDTNVTLTLGGAPTTALLEATSLTLGWTGTLAATRGGTGLSALGTALQQLRVNSGATALEYFTPSIISSLNTLTAATQTFAIGTSGSDFNIVSSVATHTFNLPDATTSVRGILSTGTQTIGGAKTHTLGLTINSTLADSDTRISGDTVTNLVYIDASTDSFALFTNTPVAPVHFSKGINTYTGADVPMVFIDSGTTTPTTMELKGSDFISGLLITNTGPFNVPYIELYNEGNDIAFSQIINTDNSFQIREGDVLGGTPRLVIESLGGTISLFGNITLANKINQYNNTAITNGQVLIGHTSNGTFEKGTLTGTTNQIIFTTGAGTITASLPQNYHTAATPQLGGLGIGTSWTTGSGLVINSTFTGTGSALSVGGGLTPNTNANGYLTLLGGAITEASSGTHAVLAGTAIFAPVITNAGASTTLAATLYISGAPSASGATNDALHVAAGTARFNGDVIPSAPTYTVGGYDVLVKNQITGRLEKTTITAGIVVVTSGAGTLTLASPNTDYIFTGTTTTWTLPAVSGNTGVSFYIKNRGSGNITLQRAGADQIYDTTAVTSITILPGEWTLVRCDGTFWNT